MKEKNNKNDVPKKEDFNPKKLDSKPSSSNGSGKKYQIALLVWLLIFLGLGIFFTVNHNVKKVTKWSQSTFEKELIAGNI